MKKRITLAEINAIPSAIVAVASNFDISCDNTGNPIHFILKVALDRKKAKTDYCEFPLFLPPSVYKTVPHIELLNTFRKGSIFVPVRCENLCIYHDDENALTPFYGFASKFTVTKYKEIEDIILGRLNK